MMTILATSLQIDRPKRVNGILKPSTTLVMLQRPMDLYEVNDLLVEAGGRPSILTIDPDGKSHASYTDELASLDLRVFA